MEIRKLKMESIRKCKEHDVLYREYNKRLRIARESNKGNFEKIALEWEKIDNLFKDILDKAIKKIDKVDALIEAQIEARRAESFRIFCEGRYLVK